jgi:hypothetical protein
MKVSQHEGDVELVAKWLASVSQGADAIHPTIDEGDFTHEHARTEIIGPHFHGSCTAERLW